MNRPERDGPPPSDSPSPERDQLEDLRGRYERRQDRRLEERRRRVRRLAWAVAGALVVLLVVIWLTLLG